MATVRWRAAQTIGLEFTSLSESAAMRLCEFIAHTSTDRIGPMINVAQIGKSDTEKISKSKEYLDPAKLGYSLESLGRMDKIPERYFVQAESVKAQEDAVVLKEKRGKKSALLEVVRKNNAAKIRQPIYRSTASPLVRWGIFLIAIFVLYQAWWKPSYRSTPLEPSQITRREGAGANIPLTLPVDSGQAPSISLNAILAELENKRDIQVKTDPNLRSSSQLQLTKIPMPTLQDKQQVVVADLFRRAAGKKMDTSPPAEIDPSRRLTPVSVNSGVNAALTPVAKLIPQPRTRDTSHFTVRFDGAEDRATWMRMQAILEYAYQEIGQKFGYVPDRPIKVVLHMKQKFLGEMGTPAWADTLFDQASGTIHIPAGQALDDLAWFSRVVRHELVHALLHARMNAQLTVAPTWVVEGLALQLAEDTWSDLDEIRKKRHPFIPLASLQGRWKGIPKDSLLMAYIEADLATRSLTERYGIHGVRQVLAAVRAGQSLDAAMQAKLSLFYDKFQQQWAKDFKVNLRQVMS